MNELENEEKKIYATIYQYYPANIDRFSPEFDAAPEHKALLNKLRLSEHDTRWNEFVTLLKENRDYDTLNRTIFGFPIPCFKANIYLKANGEKYEIVFYISIILEYFAFRTEHIFDNLLLKEELTIR